MVGRMEGRAGSSQSCFSAAIVDHRADSPAVYFNDSRLASFFFLDLQDRMEHRREALQLLNLFLSLEPIDLFSTNTISTSFSV